MNLAGQVEGLSISFLQNLQWWLSSSYHTFTLCILSSNATRIVHIAVFFRVCRSTPPVHTKAYVQYLFCCCCFAISTLPTSSHPILHATHEIPTPEHRVPSFHPAWRCPPRVESFLCSTHRSLVDSCRISTFPLEILTKLSIPGSGGLGRIWTVQSVASGDPGWFRPHSTVDGRLESDTGLLADDHVSTTSIGKDRDLYMLRSHVTRRVRG